MMESSIEHNKDVVDAIIHEMKGIKEEIEENTEELNSLLLTPKKKNRSTQWYSELAVSAVGLS